MRVFTSETSKPTFRVDRMLGLILILSVLTGAIAGCRFASEPDSKQESWIPDRISKTAHAGKETKTPVNYRAEVDVQTLDGSLWVLLNGFPTYTFSKGRFTEDHVDPPINTALVGAGNHYALRIEPWLEQSGEGLRIGSLEVGARVSVNEKQVVPGSEIESSTVDSLYRG